MGNVANATDVRWRKSGRSTANDTCVEVGHTMAAVRDSKAPGGGPVLSADARALVSWARSRVTD